MALYVDIPTRTIMSEKQYLRFHKILRSQPLRQEDLDALDGAELQPDSLPDGDCVITLKTASKAADGLWYRDYQITDFTAVELATYRSNAIKQVSAAVDQQISDAVAVYYPKFERDSWPDQRTESEDWLAYVRDGGVEPKTPVIDGALRQGESKTEYAKLIISNAEAFKSMGGAAIGALRDVRISIRNAGSKSEIDAIVESVISQ